MLKKIRNVIGKNLINIPGWQTSRKIVVFESDDWGTIRMSSKKALGKLSNLGIKVDNCHYLQNDGLASEEDLDRLFDLLSSYEGSRGNTPIITANVIMANPNFKKIKESNFNKYYYEPINSTFERYPSHTKCLKLWKEAEAKGLFFPQFHGREHLNVPLWLKLLQNRHSGFLFAFENNCWGLGKSVYPDMKINIQAALDTQNGNEIEFHIRSIEEGTMIFEKLFGYKSKSFIANNYIWDSEINKTLFENGVNYIQGMKYQKKPIYHSKERKMIRHYIGERNEYDQIYLIRNCAFEPSLKESNYDSIGECLKDITNAFFWDKPAIVTTHRLNYVGYLDSTNRKKNLSLLSSLLENILAKWPSVEFMTTSKLGKAIEKKGFHN